ncbi:MAG TPA: acyltransferase [Planktothrix sp.]
MAVESPTNENLATVAVASLQGKPKRTVAQGNRLPALTGLRGVAVLLVVIQHATTAMYGPCSFELRRLTAPFFCCWCGVDLFFVLSGFLLTDILLKQCSSPHYFRNFYARRCLRIWPLYYGFLALAALVAVATHSSFHGSQSGAALVFSALFLNNVYQSSHLPCWMTIGAVAVNHLWSLSVEEHFYLGWPLIVKWLKPAILLNICFAACVVICLARILFYAHGGNPFAISVLTPFRIDTIFAGSIVACLWHLRTDGSKLHELAKRILVPSSIAFSGLLYATDFAPAAPILATYGYSIIACTFASLLLLLLSGDRNYWLNRLLSRRELAVLGKYSYAIYIFHFPVVYMFAEKFENSGLLKNDADVVILGMLAPIIVTVGLAILSWHLLEKPFLKLKPRFSE